MTPTARRTRFASPAPSLRDRLKDPSLLREQCYIDGAWIGTPSRPVTNPVNGVELAKMPVMSTAEDDAGGRSRRARVSGLGQAHRQAALQYPAQMVRPDHRQPRGSRADPDLRAGQAAGGSARRGRYRRRLCRVLRRGSPPRLWRNHSDAARRCAAARDQAADRRLRRDHAVEFSVLDDHPQGLAGAGRRLHRGAEARQRDAADRAGAGGAGREGRRAQGRVQYPHRQFVGDRQGAVRASRRALRRLHRLDRSRQDPVSAGRRRREEARARTRRQRAVRGVRRCRYRCRGRRRDGLEIPQHGPDLRLRQPHLCAGQDLRRVRRKAVEEGRGDEDRRRHRSRA